MNWNGCRNKRSWPMLMYSALICLERLRKTTQNSDQESRSEGRVFSRWSPEYESRMPTTWRGHFIAGYVVCVHERFRSQCCSLILLRLLRTLTSWLLSSLTNSELSPTLSPPKCVEVSLEPSLTLLRRVLILPALIHRNNLIFRHGNGFMCWDYETSTSQSNF
jgi:hypothetical protein